MIQKTTVSIALCLALATAGWADFEWPAEAVTVRIENQVAPVVWRDGRPFAERSKVAPWLRIPKEGEFWVDLVEVCEEKKAQVTQKADGSIDVLVPAASAAYAAPSPQAGQRTSKRRNTRQAQQFKREFEADKRAKAMAPRLVVVRNQCYIADTEHIRAKVVIQNQGISETPPCMAVGNFVDWFGKEWAQGHSLAVPSLAPGEGVELEFFSIVHKDDNLEKADKYKCNVTFKGLPGGKVSK